MTLFSVLMVSAAVASFSSSDTRTRALLLMVCAANLQESRASVGYTANDRFGMVKGNRLSSTDKNYCICYLKDIQKSQVKLLTSYN